MSSKLFHTIVGVGIALGVASLGCSSAAEESSTDSALAYSAQDPTPNPPTDPGALCDAFDDNAWPTTKGGHHPPRPAPECIDPTHACSAQSRPFDCVPVRADGVCSYADAYPYYSVCIDGTWQCKPGKKAVDECTCWEGDPSCAPPAEGPTATR